jgi:hypothetical protein
VRRGNLLRSLLEDGTVAFDLEQGIRSDEGPLAVVIGSEPGASPAPLVLRHIDTGDIVARIPTRRHAELQAIIDTGLTLEAQLVEGSAVLTLIADD